MDSATSNQSGEIARRPSKGSVDPLNLLLCLKVLLNSKGGINGKDFVRRAVQLMSKYSRKLVSKCIYLNILLATESHILDTFYSEGGWRMLSDWLSESIGKQNWPLAEQVLELLDYSPITLERLNGADLSMVEQVKYLSVSCAHQGVSTLASRLVVNWTQLLTSNNVTAQNIPVLSNATSSSAGSSSDLVNSTSISQPKSSISATVSSASGIGILSTSAVADNVTNAEETSVRSSQLMGSHSSLNMSLNNGTCDLSTSSEHSQTYAGEISELSNSVLKSDTAAKDLGYKLSCEANVLATLKLKLPPGRTQKQQKQPKLKSINRFNHAKRVKSTGVSPVVIRNRTPSESPSTVILKHVEPVYVKIPVPQALVQHTATGLVGKVPGVTGTGRGRGRQKAVSAVLEHSPVRSLSESPKPPPIKITIKNGKISTQSGPKFPKSLEYIDEDNSVTEASMRHNADIDDSDKPVSPAKKRKKRAMSDSDSDFSIDDYLKTDIKDVKENQTKKKPLKKTYPLRRTPSPVKVATNAQAIKGSKRKRISAVIIESDESMDDLPNINDEFESKSAKAKPTLEEEGLAVKYELDVDATLQQTESVTKIKVATDSFYGTLKNELDHVSGNKIAAMETELAKDKQVKIEKAVAESKDRSLKTDVKKTAINLNFKQPKVTSSETKKSTNKEKDYERNEKHYRSKDIERRKDRERDHKDRDRKHSDSKTGRDRSKHHHIHHRSGKATHHTSSSSKHALSKESKEEEAKNRSILEKITKSTDGLGKIPKKTPSSSTPSVTSTTPMSFLDALGSADVAESVIKKPPIKMKSHGFRNTGLLDSPSSIKGPGIAGKRSLPSSSCEGNSSSSALKLNDKYGGVKRGAESSADVSDNKRLKITTTVSSLPVSGDRPGGIKLISPKRPSLSDDGGFMAALDAVSAKISADVAAKRKLAAANAARRRRNSSSEEKSDKGISESQISTEPPDGDTSPSPGLALQLSMVPSSEGAAHSPDSPSHSAPSAPDLIETPKPLNFYRDSLDELTTADTNRKSKKEELQKQIDKTDESVDETETEAEDSDRLETSQHTNTDETTDIENKDDAVETGLESPALPSDEKVEITYDTPPRTDLKSALVILRKPGPKKTVRFVPDEQLNRMHYFLLDQTERVNVSTKKFQDMQMMEKHNERNALAQASNRQRCVEQRAHWLLIPLQLPESLVQPGSKSEELHTQASREYSTMAAFYPPGQWPDNPDEPDPESFSFVEPKMIPLVDDSAPDSVKNLRHIAWPEPKLGPPPVVPPVHPMGPGPGYIGVLPGFHPSGPGMQHMMPPCPGAPPYPSNPSGDFYSGMGPSPMLEVMGSGGGSGGQWFVGNAVPGGEVGGSMRPGPPPMGPGDGPHPPGPMFPGGQMIPRFGGPIGPHGNFGGWGPEPEGRFRGMSRFRGPMRGGHMGRGSGGAWRGKSSVPCRHFLKGFCRKGDECGFLHQRDPS